MFVILNTQELVHRYMGYDALFAFYENGVRDVIRDAVLESGRRRKIPMLGEAALEFVWRDTLPGRTVQAWEEAIDAALDDNAFAVHNYQQHQQKQDREVIQLVTEQIEEDVTLMLRSLTGKPYFGIGQPSDYSNLSYWVGDDLVVEMWELAGDKNGLL